VSVTETGEPPEDNPSPWGTPQAGQGPPPAYQPPPGYYPPPSYQPPPGQYPGPPPPYWGQAPNALSPQDERTWAMFAHIGAIIASFVAMAFLAPLVILLIQGSRSPFVRRHAVEALNFQLTLLIALAAGIVASIVTLGVGLIVVVPVAIVGLILAVIFIVIGGVKASHGEDYRYPINIRMVS
jgi:uncharacterized protein